MSWLHSVRPVAVLATVTVACGGHVTGPVGPIAASPRTLSLVSGETGAPVREALVNVGGQPYSPAADGLVTVPSATTGMAIDVRAPGYLDRLTSLGSSSDLVLWPTISPTGLDEAFTRAVVYGNGDVGASLRRWPSDVRRVFVVPSPAIQADPIAVEVHRTACAILTRAHGLITFDVDLIGAGGPSISTRVDPSDPQARTGAGAVLTHSGFSITGASIVFLRETGPRNLGVLLHELGHTVGLSHSPNGTRDLMGPGPDDHTDFSSAEKLAMRLMNHRRAGNQFPDDDRRLGATTAPRNVTFRCLNQ